MFSEIKGVMTGTISLPQMFASSEMHTPAAVATFHASSSSVSSCWHSSLVRMGIRCLSAALAYLCGAKKGKGGGGGSS